MKYTLAFFLIALPAFADVIGKAVVVDGDTLRMGEERIRLHGIDAPETRQTCQRDETKWLCGQDASRALQDYVRDVDLRCQRLNIDRYGRIVAKCFKPDGMDIGAWMVLNGWALAYRRYSTDYVDAEAKAQVAGLGLWTSRFIAPWYWRRR